MSTEKPPKSALRIRYEANSNDRRGMLLYYSAMANAIGEITSVIVDNPARRNLFCNGHIGILDGNGDRLYATSPKKQRKQSDGSS